MTILYAGQSARIDEMRKLPGREASACNIQKVHAQTRALGCIGAAMMLAGCQPQDSDSQTSTKSRASFPSEITGYNHTDKSIASFDVDGIWGGNALPHTGGGSTTCCLQLPLPWHPGLTVKIDWEDEQGEHERVVAVPSYDKKSIGTFNVHFLRSGEIKVFDVRGSLGTPDYPLQGEEANLKPGVPNYQYPRDPSASQ